jgi:hypothetical protein
MLALALPKPISSVSASCLVVLDAVLKRRRKKIGLEQKCYSKECPMVRIQQRRLFWLCLGIAIKKVAVTKESLM